MPAMKDKAENCQRVGTEEAAAEIGCHIHYLRQMMRTKKWDLGIVVPPKEKGGQHEYFVFRSKLNKFLGLEDG